MTKKEFETTDEPLALIVSLNPGTGKVLHDTYNWEHADGWMEEFKEQFPDMVHFSKLNPAAIRERKKLFNWPEEEE